MGRIKSVFTGSLRRKIVFVILGSLFLGLSAFALYDIQWQRQSQEEVMLEKGKILAITGAQTIQSVLEEALTSGKLTQEQIFDTKYTQIAGTNPPKFHTAYDSFTDKSLQKLEDQFLQDLDVTFAVAVDRNGYLPTHNTKYSAQTNDPLLNRTKRMFDDPVGIAAAKNAEPFLQQIYQRDTGETMWDLSAPISVNGQHWGAFRVGFSIQRIEARLAESTWRVVGSMAAVMFVLGIIVVILASQIAKPIARAARAASLIANVDLANLATELTATAAGDLSRSLRIETEEIKVTGNDEVGEMGRAFNMMIGRLRVAEEAFCDMTAGLRDLVASVTENAEMVAKSSLQLADATNRAVDATCEIATAIEQVATGTSEQSKAISATSSNVGQLTQAIEQIARGAQDQTKNVENASTAVDRIADAIEDVASSAKLVAASSESAEKAANEGVKVVDRSMAGMVAIRASVAASSIRVKELGASSEQIGRIVETIDDIAAQTNLLALNAAIEAARAGENGRGFAVVASEVRKLAERSSRATREIADLIANVQKGTEDAVQAMEKGMIEVESGSKLAEEAAKSLAEIVRAVQETGMQFDNINAATGRMANLSREMVLSMESVSSVVEQNTASTQEMAASSSEILESITGVAQVSEQNKASTELVSSSTEKMTVQIYEITTTAQKLADMAETLEEQLSRFSIGREGTPNSSKGQGANAAKKNEQVAKIRTVSSAA